MEDAIKLLDQIVKYINEGGKDLKSVQTALSIRLRQEMLKAQQKETADSTPKVVGDADAEEYKKRLPVHKDWEGQNQPTRKPFNYGARSVKQFTDWE